MCHPDGLSSYPTFVGILIEATESVDLIVPDICDGRIDETSRLCADRRDDLGLVALFGPLARIDRAGGHDVGVVGGGCGSRGCGVSDVRSCGGCGCERSAAVVCHRWCMWLWQVVEEICQKPSKADGKSGVVHEVRLRRCRGRAENRQEASARGTAVRASRG